MKFEWDDAKDRANMARHGIGFRTAILVFEDPDRLESYDAAHSLEEDRYLTIGRIGETFVVVTVVYTERHDTIRIISARVATKTEKEAYYDYQHNA